MKNTISDIPVIRVSVKIYQVFLFAYPARFKAEYSSHMLQVFGDCCLRAFRQNGTNGMIRLWMMTLLDLIRSVIAEHLHKEVGMVNPKFIRFSGWALVLGSIALLPWHLELMLSNTKYSPLMNGWYIWDLLGTFGLVYGCILLPIGMLGLRARYGKEIGAPGRAFLMAGVLAGGSLAGFFIYGMKYAVGDIYLNSIVFVSGLFLLFISLLAFGTITIMRKPLPNGNALPLAAGLVLPFFIKIYGIFAGIRFLVESPFFLLPSIIGLIVMTIALMRFGYIMQADQARETATT